MDEREQVAVCNGCTLPWAGPGSLGAQGQAYGYPLMPLIFEAYAKAGRARYRWQIARLMGDAEAARWHRQSMLRHRAIARSLERGMNHESA